MPRRPSRRVHQSGVHVVLTAWVGLDPGRSFAACFYRPAIIPSMTRITIFNQIRARATFDALCGSPKFSPLVWACLLAVVTFFTSWGAQARLYQWRNPATGLTQMSGPPPSWYRGKLTAPRVLVYDDGALVDDTALRVSDEHAIALRQAAFDDASRRRELAALQRLEETAKREADQAERKLRVKRRRTQVARAEQPQAKPEPALGPLEQFGAETIERLKSLISEFDQSGGGAAQPGGI